MSTKRKVYTFYIIAILVMVLVLMLCNLQSPSSYMQAAFRAQNPCILTKNGQRMRKETAYIFDFDPARTLIIFDEFANNLSPATANGKVVTPTVS